jgi:hypothetical protein
LKFVISLATDLIATVALHLLRVVVPVANCISTNRFQLMNFMIVRATLMASLFVLAGCGGSSDQTVGGVRTQDVEVPVVITPDDVRTPTQAGDTTSEPSFDQRPLTPADIEGISVGATGGTYYTPVDIVPASISDAGGLIYADSGIVILRKEFITDDWNDTGGVRDLLYQALGQDFPQAANWTFRQLDHGDYITQILYWQYGLYIPSWSPYGLIVVGDEYAFLDELYRDVFGDGLEPDTDTYGMISDIVTSSSSVSSTSSSH